MSRARHFDIEVDRVADTPARWELRMENLVTIVVGTSNLLNYRWLSRQVATQKGIALPYCHQDDWTRIMRAALEQTRRVQGPPRQPSEHLPYGIRDRSPTPDPKPRRVEPRWSSFPDDVWMRACLAEPSAH